MSFMSSTLGRVLQRFLKPVSIATPKRTNTFEVRGIVLGLCQTHFVGRDLEGNKYYEYPNGNGGRSKRTVQYKRTNDMWTYVASGKRLPVQWSAWLTHTRPNPPGIEELQADLTRQQRIQTNVAILEARDKEERERVARMAQSSHSQPPELPLGKEPKQGLNGPPVDTRPGSEPTHVRDPWAEARRGSDEPQTWTPVIRRK